MGNILVISGVLFSVSVLFVLSAAVVTNPVALRIMFSIFVAFVLESLFLTSPLVLRLFWQHLQNSIQDLLCVNYAIYNE